MMSKRIITCLILLMFLLLAGGGWGVYWSRLHPPASAADSQVRALLLSADKVDVEVETIELPVGSVTKSITSLPPDETRSIVRSINLTAEQPRMWGSGYVPNVRFNFSKAGVGLGSLCTSYSVWGYHYYFSDISGPGIIGGLDSTTLLRLRQLIARHPEIVKALTQAGAEPAYLAPESFAPNRPWDVSTNREGESNIFSHRRESR